MYVVEGNDAKFTCCTLELPYVNNERNISCIPTGNYCVSKRNSPKYGDHFIIKDVPGRSYILIHHGNYHTDIRGCVLVGSAFKDINLDGQTDVINSKGTMKKLLDILPNEFDLIIE